MNEAPPINDPPPAPPPFKDRRTGLIVFGILEILLACVILLMIAAMLFGQVMLARSVGIATDWRMMVYMAAFYGGLAATFISLGIGSTLCRRWARALTLIVAWPWLAMGIITLPSMVFVLPRVMAASASQGPTPPPGLLKIIVVAQLLVMAFFFILIPAVLLFFYSRRDVKSTCEAHDPKPRWTDTVPLPVLGVALGLWLGALIFPFFGIAYRGAMPLFGTILSGLPGIAFTIVAGALWFWMGLMWYRRRLIGWWALLAALLLFGISNTITFTRIDFTEMFRKMGYPEAQIDMMRQTVGVLRGFMTWSSIIWIAPLLAFLIWCKRFFDGRAANNSPGPTPQ